MNNQSSLAAGLALLLMVVACEQTLAFPEAIQSSPTVLSNRATVVMKMPSTPQKASSTVAASIPRWQYVTSGWVEYLDAGSANAFSQLLKAFVITNQQEFEAFNSGFPRVSPDAPQTT